MASPAHPALATGAEILAILEQRPTDESLQLVNDLLDRRGEQLQNVDPEAMPVLWAQQEELERALRKAQAALEGALRQSHESGAAIKGMRTLLQPRTNSKYLSEKR